MRARPAWAEAKAEQAHGARPGLEQQILRPAGERGGHAAQPDRIGRTLGVPEQDLPFPIAHPRDRTLQRSLAHERQQPIDRPRPSRRQRPASHHHPRRHAVERAHGLVLEGLSCQQPAAAAAGGVVR
jgi:uncharacterized protein YoaH (UPF0181 family)